ncbi:hypothetical protein AVEN_191810-1 [Araneus ventricosus]|uniref:Uncharacterized protein n=1 Tax=Araneus ventricosus TaxID=182803 RepID=A0A4Y2UCE8_ARAVE|nr:hypothetical protein AVEN_191810-1 [Araneus ventricosus]
MHPSASLRGNRENAPIVFPQSGENGVVWPPLLLQHIVYNSDAVDLQVATARTRSCGRRLNADEDFNANHVSSILRLCWLRNNRTSDAVWILRRVNVDEDFTQTMCHRFCACVGSVITEPAMPFGFCDHGHKYGFPLPPNQYINV